MCLGYYYFLFMGEMVVLFLFLTEKLGIIMNAQILSLIANPLRKDGAGRAGSADPGRL